MYSSFSSEIHNAVHMEAGCQLRCWWSFCLRTTGLLCSVCDTDSIEVAYLMGLSWVHRQFKNSGHCFVCSVCKTKIGSWAGIMHAKLQITTGRKKRKKKRGILGEIPKNGLNPRSCWVLLPKADCSLLLLITAAWMCNYNSSLESTYVSQIPFGTTEYPESRWHPPSCLFKALCTDANLKYQW